MTNPIILHTLRQLRPHACDARVSGQLAITEAVQGISPHLPAHSLVILRGYLHSDREKYAVMLASLCRKRKWKLLIAGDPRLAVKVRAAGIHIPEYQGFRLSSWRRRKPGWLITMAAHSEKALWSAARFGADAALYSPVFPTKSHPGMATMGAVRFSRVSHASPIGIYALGGITAQTISRLKGSKAVGVAGVGMFATEATLQSQL